jgi:hypothetical protein
MVDFSEHFILEMDTSGMALGAVFSQEAYRVTPTIAYTSKTLSMLQHKDSLLC